MNKTILLLIVALLATAGSTGIARATDNESQTPAISPAQRFGRGMCNIITSPLELPAQIYNRAAYQEEHNSNPFAMVGGFIEGIPMGIVYFGWRLAAGCYDTATFPFEGCSQSIIDPEYVTFSPAVLETH